MSSYRPRIEKQFRSRGKRSFWRPVFKLLVWCAVAGLVYWGIDYCYTTVKKWREPHYITVQSQKEAMDQLSSLLSLWSGSNEELADACSSWDARTAWMKDAKARQAAAYLLASELENRGMRPQFRKLQSSLLAQDLDASENLPPADRKLILARALEVADSMVNHGDVAEAEAIYTGIVKSGSTFDADSVVLATDALVKLTTKRGATQESLNLINTLSGKVDLNALKNAEIVRKVARLLLLSDTMASRQTEGSNSSKGREQARVMLVNAKLTTSPDWGVISLLDIKPALANPEAIGIASLCKTLEDALICFRSSSAEELRYTPEIMLAIAQLKLRDGQLDSAILWAGRAEGSALTLGLDMPRILDGGSIKKGVSDLRAEYKQQMDKIVALKEVRDSLNDATVKLAGEQWDVAIDEARKTSVLGRKIGTFADGYIPASLMIAGKAYEGKKKWEEASSVYADLAKAWEELEGDTLKTAEANLARLKYNDFYKTVIRRLANTYRKQDMLTRAKDTLKRIGEEGSDEESTSSSGARRRSR